MTRITADTERQGLQLDQFLDPDDEPTDEAFERFRQRVERDGVKTHPSRLREFFKSKMAAASRRHQRADQLRESKQHFESRRSLNRLAKDGQKVLAQTTGRATNVGQTGKTPEQLRRISNDLEVIDVPTPHSPPLKAHDAKKLAGRLSFGIMNEEGLELSDYVAEIREAFHAAQAAAASALRKERSRNALGGGGGRPSLSLKLRGAPGDVQGRGRENKSRDEAPPSSGSWGSGGPKGGPQRPGSSGGSGGPKGGPQKPGSSEGGGGPKGGPDRSGPGDFGDLNGTMSYSMGGFGSVDMGFFFILMAEQLVDMQEYRRWRKDERVFMSRQKISEVLFQQLMSTGRYAIKAHESEAALTKAAIKEPEESTQDAVSAIAGDMSKTQIEPDGGEGLALTSKARAHKIFEDAERREKTAQRTPNDDNHDTQAMARSSKNRHGARYAREGVADQGRNPFDLDHRNWPKRGSASADLLAQDHERRLLPWPPDKEGKKLDNRAGMVHGSQVGAYMLERDNLLADAHAAQEAGNMAKHAQIMAEVDAFDERIGLLDARLLTLSQFCTSRERYLALLRDRAGYRNKYDEFLHGFVNGKPENRSAALELLARSRGVNRAVKEARMASPWVSKIVNSPKTQGYIDKVLDDLTHVRDDKATAFTTAIRQHGVNSEEARRARIDYVRASHEVREHCFLWDRDVPPRQDPLVITRDQNGIAITRDRDGRDDLTLARDGGRTAPTEDDLDDTPRNRAEVIAQYEGCMHAGDRVPVIYQDPGMSKMMSVEMWLDEANKLGTEFAKRQPAESDSQAAEGAAMAGELKRIHTQLMNQAVQEASRLVARMMDYAGQGYRATW